MDSSQSEEIERLRSELAEITTKFQVSEELKKSFESEISSLKEKLTEFKNDLDLKTSGAKASEECMKDEMAYLEKRINDMEIEIGEKTKTVELKESEIAKMKESTVAEIAALESRMKETSEAEVTLKTQITGKDNEIDKLKKELESLMSSDSGAKDLIKDKEAEILRLVEKSSLQDERVQQLEKGLEEKAAVLVKKEFELNKLQDVFKSIEFDFQTLQETTEKQAEEINQKSESNQQLQKKLDDQLNEVSVLRLEVERFQSSVKNSGESIQKSQEIESNLKQQINELQETKVKLETDITSKDVQFKDLEARFLGLEKEINERDKCIAGLEAEVKSIQKASSEKESAIAQWTDKFNELEAKSQKALIEYEVSKQSLAEELTLAKKALDETLEKLKTDFESEKNLLTSKIQELEKSGKGKDSQLDKSEKNVNLLTELKASLDEKIASKENELLELTTKFNKTERDDSEKVNLLLIS